MLYAKVVFDLAIEGPFDYIVPTQLISKIQVGVRAWVQFGTQKKLGIIVELSSKTKIKQLKEILEVLDEVPVIDRPLLLLAHKLSEYYCCTFGEAINTALPGALRKGKPLELAPLVSNQPQLCQEPVVLVYQPDAEIRWKRYLEEIRKAYQNNLSVIVLLTDLASVFKANELIERETRLPALISYRNQPHELLAWNEIRKTCPCIVVGTRSAIFSPINNLGLIIVDEEENSVYKQDQVPHYHAREIALMRGDINQAKVILGTSAPSLEAFHASGSSGEAPVIGQAKIIDTGEFAVTAERNNIIFSKYISDLISFNLNARARTLIFINRKGFAAYAICRSCGKVLKCPRCSSSLAYHFKEKSLNCRYCNFTLPAPDICPECNVGSIKYLGVGTEKIESEIYRLFPQAKIMLIDNEHERDASDADIFIATEAILKLTDLKFDLICVLSIDNSLNRVDFRSAEKVFALLSKLAGMTKKTLLIQTTLPKMHCFRALASGDSSIFYKKELKERKNLGFPPYRHLTLVKLRGKNEARVSQLSNELFSALTKRNTGKLVEIISVGPGQPEKLRGSFYRQILLKAADPRRSTKFLKINLKNFRHSGIILTVDVDPV